MKYREVMDRVELSGEARRKILHRTRPKTGLLWLPLAACLALVLLLPQQRSPQRPTRPVTSVGTQTISTRTELEAQVGFPIPEVKALPFAVEETAYLNFHGVLAQINYRGTTQTAILRQTPGTEDCSGDYTAYSEVVSLSFSASTATLKGQSPNLYTLALWTDGTYSYSLKLSTPLGITSWKEILESVSFPQE